MKLETLTKKWVLGLFMLLTIAVNSLAFADTSEKNNNNKPLIVAMSGEQPPFNFVTDNENIIGYDVELADMLAQQMGREVKIILMPFSTLQNALQEKKVDTIISGFSFSEERTEKFTFIGPYTLSGKSLLVTQERLKQIRATTGFNHKDINLIALKHSTSHTLASERLAKANLTTIEHYEDALLALRAGTADALIADLTICELAVIRDTAEQLTTLQKPLAVEEIGIAINKGEPQLEHELRVALLHLGESGKLKELHQRWFNNGAWLDMLP